MLHHRTHPQADVDNITHQGRSAERGRYKLAIGLPGVEHRARECTDDGRMRPSILTTCSYSQSVT
jgi:hypothetical protein